MTLRPAFNLLIVAVMIWAAIGILLCSSYADIDPQTIVAVWIFDEGKGDKTTDLSGNGHHGKVPANVKWVPGKFVQALKFGGKAYVTVPHHQDFNLESYSLVAYVKLEKNPPDWAGIIIKRNPGHAGHFGMWVNPKGPVHHGHMKAGGAPNEVVESKTGLGDGNWHHTTVTFDQKKITVYIDGVLESEKDCTSIIDVINHPLTIGGDINSFNLNPGVVDEAAVFSAALNRNQINEIMKQGLIRTLSVKPLGKLPLTWSKIKGTEL